MIPDSSSNLGNRRIAMLIDGDNAQPSLIEKMLTETSKYGLVSIRRIYGDWTASNMGGWKDVLQTFAIQPIQQFRYTIGKNATDSAMIIDAMDILYNGGVDGFCLVSSDSDYTRLATRIREKGFFVMGIGKKTTPRAFVNGCDLFVYTQNLQMEEKQPRIVVQSSTTPAPIPQSSSSSSSSPASSSNSGSKTRSRRKAAPLAPPPEPPAPPPPVVEPGTPDPIPLLKSAFDIAVQDDGWAFLGTVGHHLRQLDPSFDSRTYGFKQLSTLVKSYPKIFSLREVKTPDGNSVLSVKMNEV